MIKKLLNSFSDTSDGPYSFEEVGKVMAEEVFNTIAFRSSGTAVGGDGGRDGWFIDNSKGHRYKIACFTGEETSVRQKIEAEMKGDSKSYVFFCYSKRIEEKRRPGLEKQYPNLIIVDCNNIAAITLNSSKLQELFEIPFQIRKVLLETVQERCQFCGQEEIISRYIPRNVNEVCEGKIVSFDFFEWAKDGKHRLKILKASAGFGKTSMMKQLYLKLLYDEEFALPPIYYDC